MRISVLLFALVVGTVFASSANAGENRKSERIDTPINAARLTRMISVAKSQCFDMGYPDIIEDKEQKTLVCKQDNMAGEQVDTGVLFGTVKELGALGGPSAIPSILNSFKYQGFGDTPQTYAKEAIRKIGPSGLPYLKSGRNDLQKWYFSAESRSYHSRKYGKTLSDTELSNLAWGPRYIDEIIAEME